MLFNPAFMLQELQCFRTSSYFARFKAKAGVLTELTATKREDRDSIVKAATRQGMVTLATRMFGRGTDFKVFDDRMEQCGGMHVLQAFFSTELSEEVQIQGRSARQGNKGSYSLVLEVGSIAKEFDVNVEEVNKWKAESVYAYLDALRKTASLKEVQSLREMADKRKVEHDVLLVALRAFKRGSNGNMEKMLRRYNTASGLAMGSSGLHIIFCLDNSYSMYPHGWNELVNAFQRFWAQRITATQVLYIPCSKPCKFHK